MTPRKPKRDTRFIDRDIQRLKPKDKPYLESEPGGLYVRVMPSGRKSFMTVYTFDGKQRWYTIGRYPGKSLSSARKEVREVRDKVDSNIDPAQEKKQAVIDRKNAPTVSEFIAEYLTKYAFRNKKSASEDKRILEKDLAPVLGDRNINDVTRREIITLLDDVVARGPVIANRTLSVIRKMFNFAMKQAVVDSTPCSNIDPPGGKEKPKDRELSDDEIKALWPKMSEVFADQTDRALKLILVTGQRPGEVVSMEWSEINGEWWTIPADKAKNGKEHRVYLSNLALELLGESQKKGYVFPSRYKGREDKHINQTSFCNMLVKKLPLLEGVERFSPHDLRRTAATQMAELGYWDSVGRVLNHTSSTVTERHYNRYDFDKEKRAVLSAWGRKLENLRSKKNDSGKIINLR